MTDTSTKAYHVALLHLGRTKADSCYYFTTPFGITRTFRTKRAALTYARRARWTVDAEQGLTTMPKAERTNQCAK